MLSRVVRAKLVEAARRARCCRDRFERMLRWIRRTATIISVDERKTDDQRLRGFRLWTPDERAERHRIFLALAEALELPTTQINYGRGAMLLNISPTDLLEKMLAYEIPCPAVVRELTPCQRERVREIRKTYGDNPEKLRMAMLTLIREIWPGRR
jgi:hypothetical protein